MREVEYCSICLGVLGSIGCCKFRQGAPTYASGMRCAMMGDRVQDKKTGRKGIVAVTKAFSVLWDGSNKPDYDYDVKEDDIEPERA